MGVRARRCAGTLLCLVGLSSFVFFLRVFWRIGLSQALEGAKGAVYAWVLTVSILLPITVGIALIRRARSWRPFVGWWLVYTGILVLGSLLFFVPGYRLWPDLIVCGAVFGLPPMVCGLLLLMGRNQSKAVPLSKGGVREQAEG
jgi:hypothetical protein